MRSTYINVIVCMLQYREKSEAAALWLMNEFCTNKTSLDSFIVLSGRVLAGSKFFCCDPNIHLHGKENIKNK